MKNTKEITLWTIQRQEAFEEFLRNGVLFGTREHIMFEDAKAYDWMCSQMKSHGIFPEESGTYPIWAWYGKKPDLRTSGLSPRGTRLVRLELRVEACRILLSDYELWNSILNDGAITKSEEEDERYNENPKNRKRTWSRVFDINNEALLKFNGIFKDTQRIQAVLWHITTEDVVRVEHFTAR